MQLVIKVIVLTFILNSAASGNCGGNFTQFLENIKKESLELGYTELEISSFLKGVSLNPKVLEADRAQAIFQKPFNEFAPRLISEYRIIHGFKNLKKYSSIFNRIKQIYGVSPGVLASFWALETDFGAVQGDFNTRDALVTLAFDCRRPLLFYLCNGNDLNAIYDTLLKTLANDHYLKLGANALEFSKDFSWEKIVKKYISLI